jgi:two-component system, chemotaxis family, CheB/CheR fusion protein
MVTPTWRRPARRAGAVADVAPRPSTNGTPQGDPTEEFDPHVERLLLHIKEQRGFDFTGYKRASLVRRLQRRLEVVGLDSFEAYVDHLQVHPDEYAALFDTVLINVTGFFRDADAWEYLRETVVPEILGRNPRPIRIWTAGCATGEEAFSLAMTFAELMGVAEFRERVKIYATDVDEEALAAARAAVYDERRVQDVPAGYLDRYFERTAAGYVIVRDLRRSVIFGRNDIVQDAPISRVDLLTCRNTLMYFNAETQERIVRRLHFALVPDGVLFLGKAEMLLAHGELFQPVELKRRFFRRVGPPRARAGALTVGRHDDSAVGPTEQLKEEALLAGPAAQIVVTVTGELVGVNRRAELLFGISGRDLGRPFQDLEMSYRPAELRSTIEQAVTHKQPVWMYDVQWTRGGSDPVSLDIQVVPLFGPSAETLGTTVIFNDVTRYRAIQAELESSNRRVEVAYQELQSANEELETTNEELQSTIEELETTNEELQSTNEELETLNEELHSMNDELNATNEELRLRSLEVSQLNDFTETVLAGLRAGVAVVDRDLRIIAWNDEAADLWGVREDEVIGAALGELDIGLPVASLHPLVRNQLAGEAEPAERTRLSAVNRRGRPVQVDVTVSPLRRDGQGVSGAILVMNVVD